MTSLFFVGCSLIWMDVDDPSDARSIPKYVTPLPIPAVYVPHVASDGAHEYVIDVRETSQQVLPPGYPTTKVWAYGGAAKTADGVVSDFRGWPGATFEETRGVPVRVTWKNGLESVTHMFAVDPTLHWADPNDAGMPMAPFASYPPGYASAQSPVPIVTHLHGGQVASSSDGFPLAFITPGASATYVYPNTQRAATLWYHDHALGMTRLNVMAGLAGFYLLRDPNDAIAQSLPSGAFEIPLVIQDRSFASDGSFAFPADGVNPDVHPYWEPEFFGNVITVNGRTWPNLDVMPRAYRFRLLNGSNARFYNLRLVDDASNVMPFTEIGSDGGYLPKPVTMGALLLAPGERADVVVDFSSAPNRRLRWLNDANAPYPGGDPPDPETTGQIMQLTVSGDAPAPPTPLPQTLTSIATLTPDAPGRVLTLLEIEGDNGPLISTLNGQHWDAPVSETPRTGSTEDWQIVDLTDDAHPIHLHLVSFQVVSRQPIDTDRYENDWRTLNGAPSFPVMTSVKALDPSPYAIGATRGPTDAELGWKDTLVVMPGEVTTIRVRFAPVDAPATSPGTNPFPFDPTSGPGYVWHCHILDHEDNEMMRPLRVMP